MGRLDDVINVAGHRLGTMELESACQTVEEVAEAAVAVKRDEQKGHVPEVYAILKEGANREGVERKITHAIEEEIGKFARPARVHIVDDLPKTRSGKIMRRLLQNISNDEELGRHHYAARPHRAGEDPGAAAARVVTARRASAAKPTWSTQ